MAMHSASVAAESNTVTSLRGRMTSRAVRWRRSSAFKIRLRRSGEPCAPARMTRNSSSDCAPCNSSAPMPSHFKINCDERFSSQMNGYASR